MLKIFKIPKYHLYLLQLENYELGRCLKLLFKKGLLPPKEPLRKKLVWTMKAKGLFLIAVGLYVFLPILIVWLLDLSLAISIILLLIAFCFLLFLFFIFNFFLAF